MGLKQKAANMPKTVGLVLAGFPPSRPFLDPTQCPTGESGVSGAQASEPSSRLTHSDLSLLLTFLSRPQSPQL